MRLLGSALAIAVLVSLAFLPPIASTVTHSPVLKKPSSGSTAFAFVSNFESNTLEGWQSIAGPSPTVVASPSYFGEPSLASSSNSGPQIDHASQGFVPGDSFISFQVAMDGQEGSGFFGLFGQGGPVAVVGISGGQIYAGTDPSNLVSVESVPSGTAYPSGWAYLMANVYDASTPKNPSAGWVMDLFVDRTDIIAATISVPLAAAYFGALIETAAGTAYYTNIVVTTSEIPQYVPGYNNMDGYGQGSGTYVTLLPAFYKLTAEMDLNSWSTPQVGILSFQINAMNWYGTVSTAHSCVGFFQLGIDLNPGGTIAPWYVPGKNCIAHYFLSSQKPAIQPGVSSPAGTKLVLSIIDDVESKQVTFTIRDLTTSQVFTDSRPYNGTLFFSSYTQLEFQPCCNQYPIQDYKVDGTLHDMQITTESGSVESLPASYMLPFVLDAPPTWSLTYYQGGSAGYSQLSG